MFRKLGRTALVAGAALVAAQQSHASFTYSASLTIDSVTVSGPAPTPTPTFTNTPLSGSDGTTTGGGSASIDGTTLMLLDVNPTTTFTVPTPAGGTSINIGNIEASSTSSDTAGDTITIRYTDAVTVTNVAPPGTTQSGTFDLTGTLTLTDVAGSPTTQGTITNAYDNPSAQGPLGGIEFVGQAINFSSLTVNGTATGGNFGGMITAVPEPSSVALACVGGLILLAPVLRRKARVAA